MQILIVEDDQQINNLLCEYLSMQEYEVLSASHGLEATAILEKNKDIDLVLLDLMLPFRSGDMVLQQLRETSEIPVIVLSAKDTVHTKIDLIRMGADDYITKPFDLDEVLVRIEAVLRRTKKNLTMEDKSHVELSFKNLRMDNEAKVVYVKDKPLTLTSKEYGILELMLQNPTKLFSKANLFESVWNEEYFSEDTTLKVHMSNIRTKIKQYDEEEYIETIWGMGYRLKK